MRIVHLNISGERPTASRPSAEEIVNASAKRWMELREISDYRKALADHSQEIEMIREFDPGFTPIKK